MEYFNTGKKFFIAKRFKVEKAYPVKTAMFKDCEPIELKQESERFIFNTSINIFKQGFPG